ncbi:MAG: hypothetical protein AAB575_02190 [Patescibacteria group bacterium]
MDSQKLSADDRWIRDLAEDVKKQKAQGCNNVEIETFIHFYGGPPSACEKGTCNCPMH